MATFVLGTIGSSFGPIGTFIGSAVGGIIDSFIFGALLAPDPPDPQQLRAPGTNEGQPAPWGVGPFVPSNGQYLWVSVLKTVEVDGGKGGGKGGAGGFEYFVDVAIGTLRKEVVDIRRITISGEIIYDADIDVSIPATTDISATAFETRILELGTDVLDDAFLDIAAPIGGTDLSVLRSGHDCVTAGFTNAANNGTWRVEFSFKNIDGSTGARLKSPTDTPGVTEAAGASVSITQDLPEFNKGRLEGITKYLGTDTQTADPILTAVFGAGNVVGHRGTAYVMLQNLNITKWGASLPPVRCLTKEAATKTLASAIEDLVARSEFLTASDVDVTALTGITLEGFVELGPKPPADGIRQLMFVYDLEVQEQAGKLIFFERKNTELIDVPAADLAARRLDDENAPRRLRTKIVSDHRLPQELSISFLDPNRDYQTGLRGYRRVANPINTRSRKTFNLVLSALDAENLSKARLLNAHINSDQVDFQLPPNYVRVLPGDRLRIDDGGELRTIKVDRIDRGANDLIIGSGVKEHAAVFTQTSDAEQLTGGPTGDLPLPPELTRFIIDMPPLTADQAQQLGLLIATSTSDPAGNFPGAALFRSTDGGTSYTNIVGILIEANTGIGTGTLAGGVSGFGIDRVNTLTITLDSNTKSLESKTIQQALNGENDLLIGSEVVGFLDATLVSARTWTISNLIRGRRNTEQFIDNHVSREKVLDLNSATTFKDLGLTELGTPSLYKIVPAGGILADFAAFSLAAAGESLKPFSPYDLRRFVQSNDDQDYDFKRRTRLPHRALGPTLVPLEELSEEYSVDIYNSAGTVLQRTKELSGTTAFTYTSAEQTTDFGAPETAVQIHVHQLGGSVGRGRPFIVTFT